MLCELRLRCYVYVVKPIVTQFSQNGVSVAAARTGARFSMFVEICIWEYSLNDSECEVRAVL